MDEGRENNVSSFASPIQSSPSHHLPTQMKRRNEHTTWLPRHHQKHQTQFLILLILTCCISFTSATFYIEESMIEVQTESPVDRLAQSGTILVDLDPNPEGQSWTLATEDDDLLQRRDPPISNETPNQNKNVARQNDDDDSSSSSSSSMLTTATVPSSTHASKGTAGTKTSSAALQTASANEAPSPLPSPFDLGFSGNITESCSAFMDGFLHNDQFRECLPFSMLLQSSNTFFQASKSFTRITQTLDATCAADFPVCAPIISTLATNLTESTNCASDLSLQNPLITQAHLGLLAYPTLYTASCLRNPSTNSYCFADAVTNASSPTDSYVYYLPLNISLPGGSQPSCNSCLQDTMRVFGAASGDRKGVLAGNYVQAARQVNMQCGPGFVNQSLAAEVKSSAPGSIGSMSGVTGILALVMLVGSWLL